MKFSKDGIICFLITMVPLNIIFMVRFLYEYWTDKSAWTWISFSILLVLIGVGLIGYCFITKEDIEPSKHHTGEIYEVIKIEDMTGEQYLTQYSLFVLTAFAIPLQFPVIDVMMILFVELTLLVVYVANSLYYINPVLSLMQYKIFKVECKRIDRNKDEIMYVFAYDDSFISQQNQFNIKHTDNNVILIKKNKKYRWRKNDNRNS